ncbi:hypothetical protein ACFOLC_04230 [Lysobacter cavernae]|uniref:Secreted protein n=1 Tax=Lysobacter cavernae TaxID=1685901 RepID=A0ABV7RNL5_9GAMM
MPKPSWWLVLLLSLVACQRQAPDDEVRRFETVEVDSPQDGGAVSVAPVKAAPAAATKPAPAKAKAKDAIDWSAQALSSGQASISCELDYVAKGDGEPPLTGLDRDSLKQALAPCAERGVARLRYQGKIAADFTALIERVTRLADEAGIVKRVLDVDSAGGQVEDAVKAGDFIGQSRWTVWVREGAICHSACVFILSAGDNRMIAGRVGIHRIIRMSSTATTRAELNAELRVVYELVRDYLERNGAAVAVADLMMAVPNRSLRLLTDEELTLFGLDGINPAQDDLDRLRLMRKCGEDFVRRRDSFARAFDRRCKAPDIGLDVLNTCGLDLRQDFGFPDADCPAESPLSEFDSFLGAALVPVRSAAATTKEHTGKPATAGGVTVPAQAAATAAVR